MNLNLQARGLGPPHSLRTRLLLFLIAAIALAAMVQGALAYRAALAEADAIFDYHMQQMAGALRSGLPVSGFTGDMPTEHDQENVDFVVQVWTTDGLRIFESAIGAALPQRAVLGFSTVQARGTTYRVFSVQTPAQVIQVAQDMGARRAMARTLAWRTAGPIALMAPLLALAVWWVVSRSLAPVERVRREVAQREAGDLSPVSDAELPQEVQPLVHELNLLFARVQRAFDAQQHFVADAAHELRSPLAALKLQVQGLQRAHDPATQELAVARLAAGVDRATRLVEQLLVLARSEAQATADQQARPVALAAVARQGVADAALAAQERQIDVGLNEADEGVVLGHADALRILVRNLIDNAIKYTPVGGRVDVAVQADSQDGALSLVVEDSGPGIAQEERERVLDRFYRASDVQSQAPGSGLGLAIVQSVVRLHGAQLALGASERLGGLRAQVRFAVAPTTASALTPYAPNVGAA